jgi:hypothetical protein
VPQRRLHLVRIKPRVQRDEHSTELEDGVGQRRKVDAVAERDGDAVALADAELRQRGGETVGEEVERVVGEGCFGGVGRAGDDGGAVAVGGDDGGEVLGDCACVQGWLEKLAIPFLSS